MTFEQESKAGQESGGSEIPKALLDRLDDAALRQLTANAVITRRAHQRYRYRQRHVNLILMHPGGGQTTHMVVTRNISAGGLALLHIKPVQLESDCRLILPAIDKRLYSVNAVVRSCRLIEGTIHEVGVEFREPIEVAAFVGANASVRIRTG